MKKVLVLAITPPPYGGHAIMVRKLVQSKLDSIKIYHIRMSFSGSMASVGKPQLKKLFHMTDIVFRAVLFRIRYGVSTMYYVPGGASAVPVIRDIFILTVLRIFYPKLILHFHAAGVSGVVETLPLILRKGARYAYRSPDLNIYTSSRNPDNQYFRPKQYRVIHNGVEDAALAYLPIQRPARAKTTILFVGVVQESKGVKVLLEATQELILRGLSVRVDIMGEFASLAFQQEVKEFCHRNQLADTVHFLGLKKDTEKWKYYLSADVLCFPSFFEAESFGLVNIEAMMFELPVVATRWRGIPEVIDHNKTGLLVPIRDAEATADALEKLVLDPDLRSSMGKKGREKYLAHYHYQKFIRHMENAINEVLAK